MSKAISSRTFGVEFELFFTHDKAKKIIKDNVDFFLDVKTIKEEWLEDKKYNKDHKETWAERLDECINDIANDSYGDYEGSTFYNGVLAILRKRLGLKGWDIHEDGSIIGGAIGMEIVTAILKGDQGLKDIRKFLRYFGKFASVNASCGLHVHVGAQDFIRSRNQTDLVAASLLYYSTFENIFDSLVISNRRKSKNQYTKSVDYKDILTRVQQGYNGRDIQPDRYKKLNVCALGKHNTIEFRHMHGVLDPTVVTNWVKICTAYVDNIKENYKDFKSYTTKIPPDKKYIELGHKKCIEVLVANKDKIALEHRDIISDIIEKGKFLLEGNHFILHYSTDSTTAFAARNAINALRNHLCRTTRSNYEYSMIGLCSFRSHAVATEIRDAVLINEIYNVSQKNVSKTNLEGIKKKFANKAGFPKHIPTQLFTKVKKANKVIFKEKMAA